MIWIGRVFFALAIAVALWEGAAAWEYGEWSLFLFGDVAFQLFPESLNLAQAVIQRFLTPWLWDPMIQTILTWPAWPVLGGIGVAFFALARRRRQRRAR